MPKPLIVFDDDEEDEETFDLVLESNEDPEYLQNLKIVSQAFLRVNGYITKEEPDVSQMSSDQFVEYIEKSVAKDNEVIQKLSEINIEINLRSMMSKIYQHRDDPDLKMLVYFVPDISDKKSINTAVVKGLVSLMLKLDCREALMVSKKDLLTDAKERIRQINTKPENEESIYNIISYQDDNFIDISTHSFIPEIIDILRGSKTEQFASENQIDINKLPKLLSDDPMVKFYRGRIGDIFKLKRQIVNEKNMLTHQIIYRMVVRKYNK